MPLIRSSRMPCIPNAGDAHDRFIAQIYPERTSDLSRSLPFVETAHRHNTSLPYDEIAIQRAREDSLAARIDCGKFRTERQLLRRNELPAHPIDSKLTESDPDDRGILGGTEVIDRAPVERHIRSRAQVPKVEFLVGIGLINASAHRQSCVTCRERQPSCRSVTRSRLPRQARPRITTTESSPILPHISRLPCFARDSPKYLSLGC